MRMWVNREPVRAMEGDGDPCIQPPSAHILIDRGKTMMSTDRPERIGFNLQSILLTLCNKTKGAIRIKGLSTNYSIIYWKPV